MKSNLEHIMKFDRKGNGRQRGRPVGSRTSKKKRLTGDLLGEQRVRYFRDAFKMPLTRAAHAAAFEAELVIRDFRNVDLTEAMTDTLGYKSPIKSQVNVSPLGYGDEDTPSPTLPEWIDAPYAAVKSADSGQQSQLVLSRAERLRKLITKYPERYQ